MKPFYCLDSDTVSLHQNGHIQIREKLEEYAGAVGVSVITVEEAITGWYSLLRKARNQHQTVFTYDSLRETVAFFGTLPILPFDNGAFVRFEQLKQAKLNVRPMDLRIAAIALEYGAVIVTRNRRDFERVPGLVVEDWTL